MNEAYIKKENVFQRNPTDPQGSVDVSGNVIFNVKISDPAAGLTIRSWKDGFKAPISIHADIVESKVAALTSGFNEMDMHFSQTPFLDATTGQVLVRQDVGVWITSINGLNPRDVTRNQNFTPSLGSLRRTTATTIPTSSSSGGGGFGGGGGGSAGDIDFWNDLEMVKILNPATQQITAFSRCNDFGDPTGRLDRNFFNNNGSRGGCTNGTGSSSSSGGFGGSSSSVPRPAIPNHSGDGFQLTPINWDRWGGPGSGQLNSGISSTFPGSGNTGGGGRGGFGR